MKLYFECIKMLLKKYILRRNTGTVIKEFCMNMSIVYIKIGQILATQNFGNIFNEKDRQELSSICDDCNIVNFKEIKSIIEKEYNSCINDIFNSIDEIPVGSASISQVYRATLKNGKIVAVKVKRKDITDGMEKDIEIIRKLIHRFGKLIGIKNLIGGDKALDLYLNWIKDETNFEHEKQNIIDYGDFACSVNGKVQNTKNIKTPNVYEELCTDNIIVMDYIDSKTLNKMNLDNINKKVVSDALNSYLQLSFYALFNDERIIFHGDPHGGNIYIDNEGNIGFLDMGLIFELSKENSKLTREFFLSAYTNNHKKLQDLLVPFGNFDKETEENFRKDIAICSNKIQNMNVTSYFTEFIAVVAKYNMVPPEFLFCMAKAFVCLNGITIFTENITKATELLKEQTVEFYINRTIKDSVDLAIKGYTLTPKLIFNTLKCGFAKTAASESVELYKDIKQKLSNYAEVLNLLTIEKTE